MLILVRIISRGHAVARVTAFVEGENNTVLLFPPACFKKKDFVEVSLRQLAVSRARRNYASLWDKIEFCTAAFFCM